MHLFILGATGGIGRHLLASALQRGHHVTAYVRSPQKVNLTHQRLTTIQGDLFDPAQLAAALPGHDVILSAFGPTRMRATTMRRDFGHALATAARQAAVPRIQLVSAAFLFPDIGFLGRILKATLFRQMIPDMAAMEDEIRQPDLTWTIIRPPRLTNGPVTDAYRIMDGDLPHGGFYISRADVASFMIHEAENPTHPQKIVGLAD